MCSPCAKSIDDYIKLCDICKEKAKVCNVKPKKYPDIFREINRRIDNYNRVLNDIMSINMGTPFVFEVNSGNQMGDSSKVEYIVDSGKHNFYMEDPSKTYTIRVRDVKNCFITAAGGGGAGGIGFVKDVRYYSGGGGGSSACIIKRPIKVNNNVTIQVRVGRGGNTLSDHGRSTVIKLVEDNKVIEYIRIRGGLNGCPSYSDIINMESDIKMHGGKGGKGISYHLKGNDGEDGNFTYASQIKRGAGNGGSNNFFKGGKGGSNLFMVGGKGGYEDCIVGRDGKYGSGGGGSCSRLIFEGATKLSGEGGCGFVLIEW
jgi:hypothetical protein